MWQLYDDSIINTAFEKPVNIEQATIALTLLPLMVINWYCTKPLVVIRSNSQGLLCQFTTTLAQWTYYLNGVVLSMRISPWNRMKVTSNELLVFVTIMLSWLYAWQRNLRNSFVLTILSNLFDEASSVHFEIRQVKKWSPAILALTGIPA